METMLFISAPPVSIARVCWISSPAVAIAEAEFVNPVPRSAELVAKLLPRAFNWSIIVTAFEASILNRLYSIRVATSYTLLIVFSNLV